MTEVPITVHGKPFILQTCGNPRCFKQLDGGVMRFELRPGDAIGSTERSEIYCKETFAKTFTAEFDFMVEEGAPNSAEWCVIGQFQRSVDPASPALGIELKGEQLRIVCRDKPAGYIWANQADAPLIKRSRWYAMKISGSLGENGSINCWLDGRQIAAYPGKVGWANPTGYWKSGIYRAPANMTMALQVRDLWVQA